MTPTVCTLDEISPLLTQFIEESVKNLQIKAKSPKQRKYEGREYKKRFYLGDEKFQFIVSIWVDCNEKKQYDISTLAGKVFIWTPELHTHRPNSDISTERLAKILTATQSLAEIYTPIFKQYKVPLNNI